MSEPTPKDVLHQAIQNYSNTTDVDGALLTSWVVVAEWVTPDGGRWISRTSPPTATRWLRDGLLHHALYKHDEKYVPEED